MRLHHELIWALSHVMCVFNLVRAEEGSAAFPRGHEGMWTLAWSDDFEGEALDVDAWNVKVNESHCCGIFKKQGELELYLPEEVFLRDGKLVLRTRQRPAVDPKGQTWNYTSGWVDTKSRFSQRLGRFEANCSMPSSRATGVWPAFWLLPDADVCWPTGGEVDIFEFLGTPIQDRTWGSYHWARPGECGKDRAPIPGAGYTPGMVGHEDWQTGWHVYAVEWFEDRFDYYVDDVKYFTVNGSKVNMPSSPMYLIFDQAVDAELFPPGTGPSEYGEGVELQIEYVRVYTAGSNEVVL